ncbi:MAG TPA: tetratricopeptide repeat protein [Lacipirellulaceae bacterium]|nr:tetratricopeptide repeat protein [Lacipirellulaceae bacterium]HMP06223.1 tetratricopeptide repeat protein [Lacipirellulaceae bacterium]
MSSRKLALAAVSRAAVLTGLIVGSSASARAQTGQAGDAAMQEAILKALSVETLIGDSVSLSNQSYPEVENAIKRFLNNDLDGAREFLELARSKYPKLPPSDLTLAKMLIIVRNGQQARLKLEQTVAEHPHDPEAYLMMADLAFVEGRTTEAHALFDRAAEMTERFTENEKRKQNFQIRVLAGLAAIHERRLQWDKAVELLQQWVEIDPDSAIAHQRLGATLFRLNKATEALEEFKKARQLDPASNHPQVWLGQLYTQDENLAEARKNFEAAYAAESENESTARAFAEWLIQQNDLDRAQQVAAAMRQQTPNAVSALLLDGLVAKMRGQNEEAEKALIRVLELDPNNSGATNLLALILSESKEPGDLERAFSYAQRNAALFSNNAQANITLAWVLYQMGRVNESLQILSRGVTNPSADAAYLIARIMEMQKQPEKAAQVLDQFLKQPGGGLFIYRREAEAMLKRLLDSGVSLPQSGLPISPAPAGGPPTGVNGASPTNPVGPGP